jgi:NADH dehydrogenase
MTQNYKKACVFGGSGFIGRQIVRELAAAGYAIKVATRVPESAFFLKTAGNVGQIVPIACNYNDEASIRNAVKGCDVVVNCIGILFEKGETTFQKTHVDLPAASAAASKADGIERFVHISALGCDISRSQYGITKKAGEEIVLKNDPAATILRPAVVFGPEDDFFNMFAKMAALLPALPLIGGGHTRMQPVYVGNVAQAVMYAINDPRTKGHIYELGGPEVLTFREIYQRLFRETARPRLLVSLPWGIAKLKGSVMGILPKPPLTADQVESLKTDSVVSGNAKTFRDLGIVPTGMDAILPSYLARYRPGGRFGDKKRA